ncbi:MAG: 4'-phosphopantetheinyl transferase superfamily protein [Oscillospiraceae bacterium]|nr:4'-phosphopantetheinyl transferase superfamily protein [Oscillospiraceae bacterium]
MYSLYLFEDTERLSVEFTERIISVLPTSCAERADRYKNQSDRRLSAVGYLLLVYALRKDFGIKDIKLCFGEHGKPYLKGQGIYFSISHCKKGCVCAVSDKEIGADIQETRPYSQRLAEKVCCENELLRLEKASDKASEFAKIWAMKESFVKMNGKGIGYSLKKADTTIMHFKEVIEKDGFFIAVSEE